MVKNQLWLKYFRRGSTSELDTDRATSTRLYGIMLRSIASKGGGPGSRWTYLQAYGRSWKCSAQKDSSHVHGPQQPIYMMDDLHHDDPRGHDDIYNMDDSDDIYSMADFPLSQETQSYSVQSGYQDRRVLRGTSRGHRSDSSRQRTTQSFLLFVQGYTQSSRRSTTTLRDHYGQSKDVSNISISDAIKFFPYDIYPIELDSTLSAQLTENPAFLIQGFSSVQPLIQQAMQDFNMSYSDFGHKGKSSRDSKGRENGIEAQGSWPKGKDRSKVKGYKGSGYKGKGEIFDRLNQEGKGNKDSRSRPYQNWQKPKVEDYSQTSRPSAWYSKQDYDNWGSDNAWGASSHGSSGPNRTRQRQLLQEA